MMNATVKNVIFFVSGLVAGGGLGVLGAKKYLEKKYSNIAEEQIREMEEYYGALDPYRRTEQLDDYFPEETVNPTNTGRENGIMSREDRNLMREARKGESSSQTDYKGVYSTDDEEDDEEEPEEIVMDDATADHIKNQHRPPRIISEDDLGDLPAYIDHSILYYYMGDDTLTDEDGNVEENPEYLLGDCLTKYGFIDDGSTENRIFVRNYALDACYEVVKYYDSSGGWD